ncbi:MAG TPA: hypothetical protein VGC93_00830 [Thermoanaerobaculia bacterium]
MEPSKPPSPRTHVALQARLADCLAGNVVSDPREVPYYRRILGLDGGPWRETANYQAMLVASWAWRVELATTTVEERRLAMDQVRKLYTLERDQGLYRTECLCPDPHAGMHLEAHVAILRLGVDFGVRELEHLALDWLGRALRLYRALAATDGEPWAPGLRARTSVPRNQAAAALLRELFGLPHRRPNGRLVSAEELATPGTSRGPDYYGALRWLAAIRFESGSVRFRLRELALAGPFPKLLLPLRLVRFDGGLLATLERPAQPPRNGFLHPVDWLLVRWGRPGKHAVEVGRDWQTPAPEIPGTAQFIG